MMHRAHCTSHDCPDAQALESLSRGTRNGAVTYARAHERRTGHEVQVLDVTGGTVVVVPRGGWASS